MKKVIVLLSFVLLCCTVFTAVAQQTELKNLTAKQYQAAFNKLTAQGYRPVKVRSGTLQVIDYQPGEKPQLGYWGSFEKKPGGPAWVARHGLSSEAYQKEFSTWTSQGYVPTDINVAFMDGHASYCVIFDKIPNPPAWQARHGLNAADFAQVNTQFIQQGFRRTLTTHCQTTGGTVYAAVWVKG